MKRTVKVRPSEGAMNEITCENQTSDLHHTKQRHYLLLPERFDSPTLSVLQLGKERNTFSM